MQPFLKIAKALADESRLRTMLALRQGELCLCQIIELLQLAPSTVSKHLATLVQADLAQCRKEGRWHYYRLPEQPTEAVEATLSWLDCAARRSPMAQQDVKRLKIIREIEREEICACYRNPQP